MGHINKSRHVSTSTLIEHIAAANYLAFFKCHCTALCSYTIHTIQAITQYTNTEVRVSAKFPTS